ANPAGYYSVTYSSHGQVQFQELWAVPPATAPLHVSAVRIASTSASPSGGVVSSDTGSISESSVTGLLADLSSRPLKGPAFAPGALAVVNSAGMLDSVSGTSSDCVHVDGSTGP